METAARSQFRRAKKRPRSTTAAQIDVPPLAAAGSSPAPEVGPPKKRTTAAAQIVDVPGPLGIEAATRRRRTRGGGVQIGEIEAAAAVSASHIPRRRRTARIGIPCRRRTKTLRPHPVVTNPPPHEHPNCSSFPDPDLDLDLDSNKTPHDDLLQLLLPCGHNRRDLGDTAPQDLDDDDSDKLLQPLPLPLPPPPPPPKRARDEDELPKPKRARSDNLPWRDWSGLGDGPAGLIAERVLAFDVADYLRFRAVCRPWRHSSTEPRSHSGLDRRFHPWRWTMLREKLASPTSRSFLNTSTGQCIVQVDIPELRDHELLALTPEGLLVLVHDCKYIRLLNPLTRHITDLPPLTTLVPPKDHHSLLERPTAYFHTYFPAWGSGIADDDSTFVLCFNKLSMLGMAKPGDHNWSVLRYDRRGTTPSAPIMIAGRFYCVTRNAVKMLKTDPDMPPQLKVAAKLPKNMPFAPMADSMHLVNNCGEPMLVHRYCGGSPTARNKSGLAYDMYRVDLDTKKLVPVKSLGGAGRALFMGNRCSLSVSLEVFPSGSISADTIYLGFDFPERDNLDVGAYHLADGSVQVPCSLVQPHTLVDCLSLSNTVS